MHVLSLPARLIQAIFELPVAPITRLLRFSALFWAILIRRHHCLPFELSEKVLA
jgi:hypothetical protein